MKLIAGSFLLLALSAVANAQSSTSPLNKLRQGNGLFEALRECDTQKSLVESYDCFSAYGYISGVSDNDANILIPAEATYKQAFEIVETYLAKHPEKRQLASVILIRTAFKEVGWWKD
jgi:hypothetical protein